MWPSHPSYLGGRGKGLTFKACLGNSVRLMSNSSKDGRGSRVEHSPSRHEALGTTREKSLAADFFSTFRLIGDCIFILRCEHLDPDRPDAFPLSGLLGHMISSWATSYLQKEKQILTTTEMQAYDLITIVPVK